MSRWAAPAHGRDDLLWEGAATPSRSTVVRREAPAAFGFTPAASLNQATVTVTTVRDPATRYEATPMGEAVTRLYLDPPRLRLRTGLRRAVRRLVRDDALRHRVQFAALGGFDQRFCPPLAQEARTWNAIPNCGRNTRTSRTKCSIDEPFQERDLSTVKSAWLLESWIDEKTLRQIESVHDVAPGDLHHRTDLMAWLLAASEAVLATDDVFHDDHAIGLQTLSSLIDESVIAFGTGAVPTCSLVKVRMGVSCAPPRRSRGSNAGRFAQHDAKTSRGRGRVCRLGLCLFNG